MTTQFLPSGWYFFVLIDFLISLEEYTVASRHSVTRKELRVEVLEVLNWFHCSTPAQSWVHICAPEGLSFILQFSNRCLQLHVEKDLWNFLHIDLQKILVIVSYFCKIIVERTPVQRKTFCVFFREILLRNRISPVCYKALTFFVLFLLSYYFLILIQP